MKHMNKAVEVGTCAIHRIYEERPTERSKRKTEMIKKEQDNCQVRFLMA